MVFLLISSEDFEGSKQERNMKATVKDGKVKKVTTNTKNEFNQKKEYQMSTADNNFNAELTGTNQFVTRESPIKSYDEGNFVLINDGNSIECNQWIKREDN